MLSYSQGIIRIVYNLHVDGRGIIYYIYIKYIKYIIYILILLYIYIINNLQVNYNFITILIRKSDMLIPLRIYIHYIYIYLYLY